MIQVVNESNVGQRIQLLRKRCGMSIRQLAEKAGVTAGIISCIERGKNSPSISTLSKILGALDTNLQTFFGGNYGDEGGCVVRREHMESIADEQRGYTLLFPKRQDIKIEMIDEHHDPEAEPPEFEALNCDVAGYVISGTLQLEVEGEGQYTLRPGDAFYVPKGKVHRGYAKGSTAARLITVCHPAKY